MTQTPDTASRYQSFAAFYPFYISEHQNVTSRRLHVIGTGLVIAALFAGAFVNVWFFAAAPVVGYFFAWVGHFFFEKNKPATFKYPVWSLMGDFRMFFETISGRRPF